MAHAGSLTQAPATGAGNRKKFALPVDSVRRLAAIVVVGTLVLLAPVVPDLSSAYGQAAAVDADPLIQLRRAAAAVASAEKRLADVQTALDAERQRVVASEVERQLNKDTLARLQADIAQARRDIDTRQAELKVATERWQVEQQRQQPSQPRRVPDEAAGAAPPAQPPRPATTGAALNATGAHVFANRARLDLERNQYEPAVRNYDRAIRLDSTVAGYFEKRCEAKKKLQRPDAAEDCNTASRMR